MRLIAQGSVPFALVAALVACGGETKAPPKTPVPPAEEAPREPLEPAVDLSPVKAPADLVLTGRLARPAHLADTVARWAGLPLTIRQMLPSEVKWADEVVAWDAPVQMAGVVVPSPVEPELHAVVTVGLTSVDRAVAALRDQGVSVERRAPGVFRVDEEDESSACAVAASRGSAPARLVCSPSVEALESLLPFATRGLPDLPAGPADFEIDFNPEPMQRLYAQQIASLTFLSGFLIREVSLDQPAFDRALADAVYAVAGELQLLANDLSRVRIEGKLDEPASAIDLSVTLALKGDKSWTGQLLAEASAKSGAAPESFWQLPQDSTSAGYLHAVDAARFNPIVRTLADLADGYLAHERIGRGARERVKALILNAPPTMTSYAQAQGFLPQATPPGAAQMPDWLSFARGWEIFASEAPAAAHVKLMKNLHDVLSDRDLRKLVARELSVEPSALPTSQIKPFAGKGVPAGGTLCAITVPPELLEKDTLSVPDAAPEKLAPVRFVVAVVPHGKGSLFVLAPNDKTAAERVVAFKTGKTTLSQRTELASLRTEKAVSAGFGTLLGLIAEVPAVLAEATSGKDLQQVTDALPHRGRAPILSRVTVEKGNGLTLRMVARLPRAVVEDGAALVPTVLPKRGLRGHEPEQP